MSSEVVGRAVRTFLKLDVVGRTIFARQLRLATPVREEVLRGKFEQLEALGTSVISIIEDMESEL